MEAAPAPEATERAWGRDAAVPSARAEPLSMARRADRVGPLILTAAFGWIAIEIGTNVLIVAGRLVAGDGRAEPIALLGCVAALAPFYVPALMIRNGWRQSRVRLASHGVRGLVRRADVVGRRTRKGGRHRLTVQEIDWRVDLRLIDPPYRDREIEVEWTTELGRERTATPAPGRVIELAIAPGEGREPIVHGPASRFGESYAAALVFGGFLGLIGLAFSVAATNL